MVTHCTVVLGVVVSGVLSITLCSWSKRTACTISIMERPVDTADTWQTHGIHGRHMANTWQLRQTHGRHERHIADTADTLQTHGTHGGHLAESRHMAYT